MGEHCADVTDTKQRQVQRQRPPFLTTIPQARADLGLSVLCFPLFSVAVFVVFFFSHYFPFFFFGYYDSQTVFIVLYTSPPFSFQSLDGSGSSLTSHYAFPKPELKTKKMLSRANLDAVL